MTDKEEWLEDIHRLQNCLANIEDALQYEEYVKKMEERTDFCVVAMTDVKMLGLTLDGAFHDKLPEPKVGSLLK